MKTKLFAVAASLLLSVAAAGTCYAQQTTLAVKIPFEFQAGGRTLPAGEYRVESTSYGSETIQRLRQVDGDAVTVFVTMSVAARNGHENPELVFNCYGETRFLSQIWTGDGDGRQLLKSSPEKQAAAGEGGREIALLLQPTLVRP